MALFDYNLARELGNGSFGTVYLATHKRTKAKFAIKMIDDSNDSTAIQEVEILKKTSHKYIIKYHQSFYSKGKGKLCIVLEFADHGTLESSILECRSNTQEYSIWRAISHISSALSYLHGLRPEHILHRDLKPANILGVSVWNRKFQEDRIAWKLADFGIAKLLTMEAQQNYYTSTIVGTPTYMAPEVLRVFQSYSFPADIWSLGALISFMCNKEHLFMSQDDVMEWGVQNPLPGHFSSSLRDLVTQMLHPKHRKRPTAAAICSETYEDDRQRDDI